MVPRHHAANCRWAVPTLFLDDARWLDASDCPWTCVRRDGAGLLQDARVCDTCPRWEPAVDTANRWAGETWTNGIDTPLLPDVLAISWSIRAETVPATHTS